MNTSTYNGWANYNTWNVALWINNDEFLYNEARRYVQDHPGGEIGVYQSFAKEVLVGAGQAKTPDEVPWLADDLDHEALDEMMRELGEVAA